MQTRHQGRSHRSLERGRHGLGLAGVSYPKQKRVQLASAQPTMAPHSNGRGPVVSQHPFQLGGQGPESIVLISIDKCSTLAQRAIGRRIWNRLVRQEVAGKRDMSAAKDQEAGSVARRLL